MQPSKQIDAVITWVDGAEPGHGEKRRELFPDGRIPRGGQEGRFASSNEIVYCVLSILKFAPYIRKIFIVTDDQTPPIFDAVEREFPGQADKISIIDHREIFSDFPEALPTFSSISIETVLYRIPGLSEHFLYFNDDFFLVRETQAEDWWSDGKTILRGTWLGMGFRVVEAIRQSAYAIFGVKRDARRVSNKTGQFRAARLSGFGKRFFMAAHTPYPLRISTIETVFEEHTGLLARNIAHRFRSEEQFVLQSLANHVELRQGSAQVSQADHLIYVHADRAGMTKAKKKIQKVENDPEIKFLCLQNLHSAEPGVQEFLLHWLKGTTAAR